VLDEDAIRKLVTPEHVCAVEAMLFGQQRLMDAGYSLNFDGDEDQAEGAEEGGVEVELQLAPWIISKNFLLAVQAKGMLKLYGPGDPTGRGEGFSLIRHSMKSMFHLSGTTQDEIEALAQARERATSHKFSISDQQAFYKVEKERIWRAQQVSLSSQVEPELTAADEAETDDEAEETEEEEENRGAMERIMRSKADAERREEQNRRHMYGKAAMANAGPSPMPSMQGSASRLSSTAPSVAADDMDISVAGDRERGDETSSIGGTATFGGIAAKNRLLVIKRLVRKNGGAQRFTDTGMPMPPDTEWRTEVVADAKVISAYMRQRKILETKFAEHKDLIAADPAVRRRLLQEHLGRIRQLDLAKGKRKTFNDEISGMVIDDGLADSHAGYKSLAAPVKLTIDMRSAAERLGGEESLNQLMNNAGGRRKRPRVAGDYEEEDAINDAASDSMRMPGITIKLGGSESAIFNPAGRERAREESLEALSSFNKLLHTAVHGVTTRKEAASFLQHVPRGLIPDYYSIVKNPLTLGQVRQRAKEQWYRDLDSFWSDMDLLVANCAAYNGPDAPLTRTIQDLHDKVQQRLRRYKADLEAQEQRIQHLVGWLVTSLPRMHALTNYIIVHRPRLPLMRWSEDSWRSQSLQRMPSW
jgi:hypothetical protein